MEVRGARIGHRVRTSRTAFGALLCAARSVVTVVPLESRLLRVGTYTQRRSSWRQMDTSGEVAP
ncbi:hypothetical protein PR003_g17262 [Phytophthora rubi]|uniref:Uncharacterized protein n=1 Tax=Phytophthora rubi TaxID=129364 RepID=A0A6A3KIA0_9STRA|nr:hypothetical protein PR002_g16806 [Phytophthora rubi]KAE9009179.1 hypothetical protein PR001_g16503 [Phytophthora rubi]KAE9322332.1 hypothetical protein PR003_g17262 [Phytophthora rubi]